ncbi:MAG: sensor histidine kinase [Streptosporangiales bacterium]
MIPLPDLALVVAYALPATATVAALGAGLLYAFRRSSLRLLHALLAAAIVLGVLAGIVVVAQAMLLSEHDLSVVMVVVVVSALAGLAASWLLGRRLVAASHALEEAGRTVGSDTGYTAPELPLPAELAAVSTELARTDRRLSYARAREDALEASRRDLVAWVSHDLRTPLAGIRAMAEALEDGLAESPETAHRYYREIGAETDRLAGMVQDLFELSRIHTGALRLSLQRVGLDDLVTEAVTSVEPVADANGVRVCGTAAPHVPVRVDAAQMGRVLRNLLINAIRHTPSDGSVEVAGTVEEGLACVAVSDTCGGIPDDDLPKVFDIAFRGESARTPTSAGGGLGLAIARGIVEAHAGGIGVQNTGPGCRFLVRLPLEATAS